MLNGRVDQIKLHLKNVIEKEANKLCYLAMFGSVLYPERFDKAGKGTSDIDFAAVVEKDFMASEFHLQGFSRNSPGYLTFGWAVFKHDNGGFPENWAEGRNIDLVVISLSRFDELLKDIKNGNKERVVKEMSGSNAFLYAFAEGISLFNSLDNERKIHLETLKTLFTPEVSVAVEYKRKLRGERE